MITDTGGVDDKSFNQSTSWEGLQAWGKENGLEKGAGGYNYFQSDDAADYANNINTMTNGFHTIFGIGYLLKDDISSAAAQNPDVNFGLIDDVIEDQDNVVSATFKDHEASYLAGIAAAYTTKTDRCCFVGGKKVPLSTALKLVLLKG